MELFDLQEYARARHRDALRSFRFAERSGLTREGRNQNSGRGTAAEGGPRGFNRPEWSANYER